MASVALGKPLLQRTASRGACGGRKTFSLFVGLGIAGFLFVVACNCYGGDGGLMKVTALWARVVGRHSGLLPWAAGMGHSLQPQFGKIPPQLGVASLSRYRWLRPWDGRTSRNPQLRSLNWGSAFGGNSPETQPFFEAGNLSKYVTKGEKQIPRMIYEPPYREVDGRAQLLVTTAFEAGFRAVDVTKQDVEQLSGLAVAINAAFNKGLFTIGFDRAQLFVQTRFDMKVKTQVEYFDTEDGKGVQSYKVNRQVNLDKPVSDQVTLCVERHLDWLKLEYIDSMVVPYMGFNQTMLFWRKLEEQVKDGTIKQLAISTKGCPDLESVSQLEEVYANATVKPSFVIGEAEATPEMEIEFQAWCDKEGLTYQSFRSHQKSDRLAQNKEMMTLSEKYGVSPRVLYLRYLMGRGSLAISDSGSKQNLTEDFMAFNVDLTAEDAMKIDEMRKEDYDNLPKEYDGTEPLEVIDLRIGRS